jgi:phosphocarrier protein FPr
MVGLLIVSHSATLAAGVTELAEQMAQGRVPIAQAGGMDDPDDPIGTDPMRVVAGLEALAARAEVTDIVVFMDLGSAVMSAEMALEFVAEDVKDKVKLCSAPLVEGVLAAAASAAVGASVNAVIAEAKGALIAKAEQLGEEVDVSAIQGSLQGSVQGSPNTVTVPSLTWQFTVPNALGLHARPIARLMHALGGFHTDVTLAKNDVRALATSMSQLARLSAEQGEVINVELRGDDAEGALEALQALVANNLGDPLKQTPAEVVPAASSDHISDGISDDVMSGEVMTGLPASSGIALAPAFWFEVTMPDPVSVAKAQTDPGERDRLMLCVHQAERDLEALALEVGGSEAGIFEAQAMMLRDPELRQILRRTLEQNRGALFAWISAVREVAKTYDTLDSHYLQARATDVLDIGVRVLRLMQPNVLQPPAPVDPVIVLATDLTPSQTVQLDASVVRGIVTERGSATSHSAILSRSLGIPAVVGIGKDIKQIMNDHALAIDGGSGKVWLEPDTNTRTALEAAEKHWRASKQTELEQSYAPAISQDGVNVAVYANVASAYEAERAASQGAQGIGLFRSEFLFIDRQAPPGEDEQLAAYAAAAKAFEDAPVIIRTLDVGGDKPLSYLHIPEEANPFLGWRGLRYCLETPELFKTQLRALCRASAFGQLQVMFPMVSTPDEVSAATNMLLEVQAELTAEGHAFDANMEVGVMIEVPAAVWHIERIASLVDFVSIGTNDLCQYIMAADRGNSRVAAIANPFDPAVLRAIKHTADAVHAAGGKVGMCGEMAGDPAATALLLGLGIDELSMSAPRIPEVKAVIRELQVSRAKQVATDVLAGHSAFEVQSQLRNAFVET